MEQQPGTPPPTGWRPPPPPPEAWQRPVRVEPVPDSPYVLAILGAPVVTAGHAVGALVTGAAAVTVALLMGCGAAVALAVQAELAAEAELWGMGAFAVLSTGLGVSAIVLGVAGMRRTRRPGRPQPAPPPSSAGGAPGEIVVVRRGYGLAVSGVICGVVGLGLTGLMLLAIVLLSVF